MDLGVLAMEREEHLDLLEIEMMNLLWGSFRLSFVWIHNFAVVVVVVVVAAAAEHIAADSNCCFHSHHHISAAAAAAAAAAVVVAVEGDILRNTHRFREPTMLKRRPRQRRGMREQMI